MSATDDLIRRRTAEEDISRAFGLIALARSQMSLVEFEQYVRENLANLGSRGFVKSIGEAAVRATTDDLETAGHDLDLHAEEITEQKLGN